MSMISIVRASIIFASMILGELHRWLWWSSSKLVPSVDYSDDQRDSKTNQSDSKYDPEHYADDCACGQFRRSWLAIKCGPHT